MFCCKYYRLHTQVPDFGFNFNFTSILQAVSSWTLFTDVPLEKLKLLYELIMIRDGIFL
jgi:hypothetical protein